jgi:hypothetical protein
MSEIDKGQVIERRSELLATVVLTRRLNVDVHPFDAAGDIKIDLIGTIRPAPQEELKGFLPFGVVVWGTAKELTSEMEATKFGRSQKKKIPSSQTKFYMPVIVLLFSMHKDEAFFSWLVKPCKETNKLVHASELDFTLFDVRQLDKMVQSIKNWYKRLSNTIVADADEFASAHCADGD